MSGSLDFGAALAALKNGERVARAGWNGKGMWLVIIRAGNAMHNSRYGYFDMQDCIGMKTAQNVMQPGWLASQNDLLAEDWEVLDEAKRTSAPKMCPQRRHEFQGDPCPRKCGTRLGGSHHEEYGCDRPCGHEGVCK